MIYSFFFNSNAWPVIKKYVCFLFSVKATTIDEILLKVNSPAESIMPSQ